jgi:hypothetical protein
VGALVVGFVLVRAAWRVLMRRGVVWRGRQV